MVIHMQPMRQLATVLASVATAERCIFSVADLQSACPELAVDAFRVLLSRAAASGLLERVCRGIYLYPRVPFIPGVVLPSTAGRLRRGHLCYVSLESALSEHGIISQMPIDRLCLMTNGRKGIFDCGRWGTIEFIHTDREPASCRGAVTYDRARCLWVARPALALEDLRHVGRNLDLVRMDHDEVSHG